MMNLPINEHASLGYFCAYICLTVNNIMFNRDTLTATGITECIIHIYLVNAYATICSLQ